MHLRSLFLIVCLSIFVQTIVYAQETETQNTSIFHALESAYNNNASLRAARQEYKASQEQLPLAQSGFKPTLSAGANVTYADSDIEGQSFVTSAGGLTTTSAEVTLDQPLFRGGRTLAEVSAARNNITANALVLSAAEQSILYETAVVYMDLLQNKVIVDLNNQNVSLVERELSEAEARFELGVLTRTDVSQARARLAQAQADAIDAITDLETVKAAYVRATGEDFIGAPIYPSRGLEIPEALDEVISLARSNNRQILQAKFITRAAKDEIDSVRGELLPQISAQSAVQKVYRPTDFIDEQEQFSVGVSASISLYEGGATRTRLREAKIRANQRAFEIDDAVDTAREEAVAAWEALKSSRSEIAARLVQVDAAKVAQEGVHIEADVGERTVLDKLNANQEVLDAEVDLAEAKGDEIIAQFNLARILGLLVPQKLGFAGVNP